MYDVSEISLQTTALSALQYLQKRESNVDYCPWPWSSLNFMTQSHTDLGHLDFWRHLDKDVTVIITLLIIIIITSNNRHEQCLPNSISVQLGLAVRDCLSYLERRTDDIHLLWLKPVPRRGMLPRQCRQCHRCSSIKAAMLLQGLWAFGWNNFPPSSSFSTAAPLPLALSALLIVVCCFSSSSSPHKNPILISSN